MSTSLVHSERLRLSRRLLVAVAVPVVMLATVGAVLGHQILKMNDDAQWVEHSDQVVTVANETIRQIVDQETGVRGYLLSHDEAFLEPFERADPLRRFAHLHDLVADNPQQQDRFDEARRLYERWFATIQPVVTERNLEEAKTRDALLARKSRMDAIRETLRQAMIIEERLRHDRVAAADVSAEVTRLTFFVLLAVVAAVLAFFSRRQLGSIATNFGALLEAESRARQGVETEAWVRAGHAKLADVLQGEKSIEALGTDCLLTLAESTGAQVGAFFTKVGGHWCRRASHAIDPQAAADARFADGEGLVGQTAVRGTLLHVHEVPPDFWRICSGTGGARPGALVLLPGRVGLETKAVIELGYAHAPSASVLELLGRIGASVALAVQSAEYQEQLRALLEEAQRQAEELQTQQEELRVTNEELEAQTTALKASHRQLETQQAELEQTNEHLAQQSKLLEKQNQRLVENQAEITAKAREVERASQFKSDFLSTMSHELRTPLNSSLILSKLLADNKAGNLSGEQVRYAETIYAAGNDLLALINDILDLSKIESGKVEVHATPFSLAPFCAELKRKLSPLASKKGLHFLVSVDPQAPETLQTDAHRVEQILNNLVSNALKFTAQGEVAVDVVGDANRVTFHVRDTGIGISQQQQEIIFEAFRQADATTSRKYGGTGLGLSIARQLARLLGGDISVRSEAGKGSTFTFWLPRVFAGPLVGPMPSPTSSPLPEFVASASEGEQAAVPPEAGAPRTVLVIEDDASFARILAEVAAESGFRCLVAPTAQQGLELAKKCAPVGILLDLKLPDHPGLSVLDRLKRDPSTRHIPVHILSVDDASETALSMGAAAYLLKPVRREQLLEAFAALGKSADRRPRRVLVVEDDAKLRDSVISLLGRNDVEICAAASVTDALTALRDQTFDCVVTDLGFPDQSGYELLEAMATQAGASVPPVIVYTGRELTADEEQRLRRYSQSIIVKGAKSHERLLDEVTLFLHRVEADLPANQRQSASSTHDRETVFEGRTILVVEDDVRNIFALTSVLEPKGAQVKIARNGREALTALEKNPGIDLVLMDIMMPEMDGLEAMQHIRKNPRWAKLPVVALTAKAMRDDQEKCLAAGANDYLAKPLNIEMLLSLLRVWMPRN